MRIRPGIYEQDTCARDCQDHYGNYLLFFLIKFFTARLLQKVFCETLDDRYRRYFASKYCSKVSFELIWLLLRIEIAARSPFLHIHPV